MGKYINEKFNADVWYICLFYGPDQTQWAYASVQQIDVQLETMTVAEETRLQSELQTNWALSSMIMGSPAVVFGHEEPLP